MTENRTEPKDIQSITIVEAIREISNNHFLLPELQRKFVWTHEQVEKLFDSIMRGYPMNTFMFWNISNAKIKDEAAFYKFIHHYQRGVDETNESQPSGAFLDDFVAVIDGQQRLTALYIGLCGTYAYKNSRSECPNDQLPKRSLYLNVAALPAQSPISSDDDTEPTEQTDNDPFQYENDKKIYNFRFLTSDDLKTGRIKGKWFPVGAILGGEITDDKESIQQYLQTKDLLDESNTTYAIETVQKLWRRIHEERLINYYLLETQDVNDVLGIFVRTNSGGTRLQGADLLMSFTSTYWTAGAREKIEELSREVAHNIEFKIDHSFILKACLAASEFPLSVSTANLTAEKVKVFEKNWDNIEKSVKAGFRLIRKLGFRDNTFSNKYIAIPLIYHIYINNIADNVLDPLFYFWEHLQEIKKWIALSALKRILTGNSTDSNLRKMSEIISANRHKDQCKFPATELMSETYGYTRKIDYTVDEKFIDDMLYREYGADSYCVLQFIYDFDESANIEQDHMHPKSLFNGYGKTRSERLLKLGIPESDIEFALENRHWNSVLNLQFLYQSENISKSDKPLDEWIESCDTAGKHKDLFVEDGTSLKIADFKAFIESRKKVLTAKLMDVLGLTK